MSCCGGVSAPMAQARGRALTDAGAARGALVVLEYTGDERRTLPYVAAGKPYFFGVNKRINAVPARVVPQFLDPAGRYYGQFERVESGVQSQQQSGVLSQEQSGVLSQEQSGVVSPQSGVQSPASEGDSNQQQSAEPASASAPSAATQAKPKTAKPNTSGGGD